MTNGKRKNATYPKKPCKPGLTKTPFTEQWLHNLTIVKDSFNTLVGENSRSCNNAALYLANSQRLSGRYRDAAENFEQILSRRKKTLGADHPSYADAAYLLAETRIRLGECEKAESLLRESLAIRRRVFGQGDASYVDGLLALSEILVARNSLFEAEATVGFAQQLANKLDVDIERQSRIDECRARVCYAFGEQSRARQFIERSVSTAQSDSFSFEEPMRVRLDVYRKITIAQKDESKSGEIERELSRLDDKLKAKQVKAERIPAPRFSADK